MTPIKLAITGRFRRGKDTVADLIMQRLPDWDGALERLAFGDALKDEVSEMVHLYLGRDSPAYSRAQIANDGSFKYSHVTLVQHLGWMKLNRAINGPGYQWWGEFRRRLYGEDYWLQHPLFVSNYMGAVLDRKHILLTDVRHFNEAEWCKKNGFYLVRIEGPCRASNEIRDPEHESERHIDKLPVDTVIYNTGSYSELEHTISEFVPFLLEWFKQADTTENRDANTLERRDDDASSVSS